MLGMIGPCLLNFHAIYPRKGCPPGRIRVCYVEPDPKQARFWEINDYDVDHTGF